MNAIEAHYANPKSLASTQWVAEHLDDPKVRIVEVIWGSQADFGLAVYEAGHIPGAIAWDSDKHYRREHGDVINRSDFEQELSRSGINPETTIVLYSCINNLLATFDYWLLKYYGHRDVRLLDGDREKWLAEGRPLEQSVPEYRSAVYTSGEPNWGVRASRADVLEAISKEDVVIVDARSAAMYSGESHPGTQHGGHIPGAINLPAHREVDAEGAFVAWRVPTVGRDGTFKSYQELEALFDGAGITPEREIVTYCLAGGLSTHTWFVLTQLLGYPNVREYDRSWAEWGNLEGVPIET